MMRCSIQTTENEWKFSTTRIKTLFNYLFYIDTKIDYWPNLTQG